MRSLNYRDIIEKVLRIDGAVGGSQAQIATTHKSQCAVEDMVGAFLLCTVKHRNLRAPRGAPRPEPEHLALGWTFVATTGCGRAAITPNERRHQIAHYMVIIIAQHHLPCHRR